MSCQGLATTTHATKAGAPRIQRKCSGAKANAQANEAPCAQCQAEAAHAVGAAPLPPAPPRGFEIGAHDDAYEREADRMAHQVMNGKPTFPASTVALTLQRLPSATTSLTQAPAGVQKALATPGMPLDRRTRSFFEPRFGRDFSSVRVHADDAAHRSAQSLDAQAYAVGHHVVFSRGKYSPRDESGRRLLAHELAHVVQQSHSPGTVPPLQRKKGKGKGPGSCGYFSALADTTIGGAAHVQIQRKLLTRGLQAELEIPRATKLKGLTRGCQKLGTPAGFADLARVVPGNISLAEIKPFYIAKTLGRLEVRHYQRRAEHSQQRITRLGTCGRRSGPGPDDWGFFYRVGAIGPATKFTLLAGAITGDENFGAFALDKKLDLVASEVGGGGVGYWCRQNAAGKAAAEEEKKKKKKKPKGKGGGANLGIGVSVGGSSAGAGNVGVGVSIDSNSASVGTVGASVAISSDSATAGAVGASSAKDSMSATAAAAGASSAKESENVTAGAAGASKSSGSTSASAGVAGKSKSQDDIAASAGQAGKSESKDSLAAAAGGKGSGKAEGVVGAGKGGTPKKPIDPNDVSGKQAEKTPDDAKGDAEAAHGEGKRGGGEGGTGGKAGEEGDTSAAGGDKEAGGAGHDTAGTGTGGKAGQQGGGKGQPGQGGKGQPGQGEPGGTGDKGAGDKGTAGTGAGGKDQPGQGQGQGQGQAGGQTKPVPGQGPGTGKGTGAASNPLGVYTVIPLGTSEAERERIAEEAAKVAVLVQKASEAQKDLLRHLSSTSPDKRYLVPTSFWVEKMMNVTKGLSVDDIQYLKQLNWTPGRISEAELRKRIEKILATKPKTPPKGQGGSMKAPDVTGGKGGGKGAAQGGAEGQGSTGKKAGAGSEAGPKASKDRGIELDRATAPPKGSDRTTAGDFTYVILSGISHQSQLKPGQAVSCRVRIHDLVTENTFDLDDVSITFVSRTDTPVTIKGVRFANIKFKLYFTRDFWSEKNKFYGKGGEDTAAEYDFGRRKVK